MFLTSDSFLHFVLDADHDIHCTNSMVALMPEVCLWHELCRQDPSQNILLFDVCESGQLRAEVFDTDSQRFLIPPQKSFFSFVKQEQLPRCIAHSSHSLSDAKLTLSETLSKLLRAASAKNAQRSTSLIFTHNAFEKVCRAANSDGVRLLNDLLDAPADKCRLFIRLSLRADRLEDLVRADTSNCPHLHRAYERIHTALSVHEDELVHALENQLGNQLIRMDRTPEDLLNLLLMRSAAEAQSADPLDQLADQAEYLELCRLNRIGPLAPASGLERFTPVSRRHLNTMLRDPEFRSQVRRSVARLRSLYPNDTITQAMQREALLPSLPPPCPVYDDELSRLALSLQIPDSCSQKAVWEPDLEQLKRNLCTLWNKPRNSTATKALSQLCREADGAIKLKSWRFLGDIMPLLKFYSARICAPAAHNKTLEGIWEDSFQLIHLSRELHAPHTFGLAEGIEQFAQMGIDSGNQILLEGLRALVRRSIARFEEPNIDIDLASKKILADRERTYEQVRRSQENIAALREKEQKQQQELELQRRRDELERKYTLGATDAPEPDDFDPNNYLLNHRFA